MTSILDLLSVALLILAAILLYWHLLGYPFLMSTMRRRRRPSPPLETLPVVTVVLPVYNEAKNMGPRVQNLLDQDYPRDRLEIVIVESGSTDGTLAEARDLAVRVPNLKVVAQPTRLGKAAAVAAGKAVATGSILVVSDANTIYSPSTIRKLVQPFGDPNIGGVGGRFVPKNAEDPGAAGSNLFWSLEEIVRAGEAALDSCCTFHGEVYAFRRELVEPDGSAILDDLDTAVQIRRKGFRVGYAPEAFAYEAVPTSVRDMTIQWRKNALGAIQCGFRNLRFLVSRPSYYTYLIFPSHKGLQVLQPFLLILAALAFLAAVLSGGLLLVSGMALLVFALLSLATAALLLSAMGRGGASGPDTKMHPGSWIRTFFAFQYAVLLGWKDYLLGRRDVRWEKVESTRT